MEQVEIYSNWDPAILDDTDEDDLPDLDVALEIEQWMFEEMWVHSLTIYQTPLSKAQLV